MKKEKRKSKKTVQNVKDLKAKDVSQKESIRFYTLLELRGKQQINSTFIPNE